MNLFLPSVLHVLLISSLILICPIIFDEDWTWRSSLLCNFIHPVPTYVLPGTFNESSSRQNPVFKQPTRIPSLIWETKLTLYKTVGNVIIFIILIRTNLGDRREDLEDLPELNLLSCLCYYRFIRAINILLKQTVACCGSVSSIVFFYPSSIRLSPFPASPASGISRAFWLIDQGFFWNIYFAFLTFFVTKSFSF
jgi:hypothetical protein